jgi:dimethylargininase
MFTYAVTRQPGTNFAQGLTTANLGTPDYDVMLRQHAAYVETLRLLGVEVVVLEALPDYPDAYFVEDVAVVTPEVAVITRPGAPSRQGEVDAILPILARYRPLERIQPPGTLDGGDVLVIGKHVYIGLSQRTDLYGAVSLGQILEKYGYTTSHVLIGAGLHLKSSINYVADDTVLIREVFTYQSEFDAYQQIIVEESEAYACNTLLMNDCLITPLGFPHTRAKLARLGRRIIELDVSEAHKMDGGLTCMSLRF